MSGSLARDRDRAIRDLKRFKKKQLEQVCKEAGVNQNGLKGVLLERLVSTIDMSYRFAADAAAGQTSVHAESLRRIFRAVRNACDAEVAGGAAAAAAAPSAYAANMSRLAASMGMSLPYAQMAQMDQLNAYTQAQQVLMRNAAAATTYAGGAGAGAAFGYGGSAAGGLGGSGGGGGSSTAALMREGLLKGGEFGLTSVVPRSERDPFVRTRTVLAQPFLLAPSQRTMGTYVAAARVHLTAEQHQEVMRSGAEPRRGHGQLRVLLRAYRLHAGSSAGKGAAPGGSSSTLKPEERGHLWPVDTCVVVNGRLPHVKQRKVYKQGLATKYKGDCDPVDIFPYLRAGANDIEVRCNDPEPFAFIVQLVENVGIDAVLESIKERKRLSEEAALERVRASFRGCNVDDDDGGEELMATSTRLSLRCPLGLVPITVPGRGVRCTHLQCFDLTTFLSFNEKNSGAAWRCCVCNTPIEPSDITVDAYLWKVLQELGERIADVEDVEIHHDGTWAPVQPSDAASSAGGGLSARAARRLSGGGKLPPPSGLSAAGAADAVSVDDSADSASSQASTGSGGASAAAAAAASAAAPAPPPPAPSADAVIDLSLDSDDDEPPPPPPPARAAAAPAAGLTLKLPGGVAPPPPARAASAPAGSAASELDRLAETWQTIGESRLPWSAPWQQRGSGDGGGSSASGLAPPLKRARVDVPGAAAAASGMAAAAAGSGLPLRSVAVRLPWHAPPGSGSGGGGRGGSGDSMARALPARPFGSDTSSGISPLPILNPPLSAAAAAAAAAAAGGGGASTQQRQSRMAAVPWSVGSDGGAADDDLLVVDLLDGSGDGSGGGCGS